MEYSQLPSLPSSLKNWGETENISLYLEEAEEREKPFSSIPSFTGQKQTMSPFSHSFLYIEGRKPPFFCPFTEERETVSPFSEERRRQDTLPKIILKGNMSGRLNNNPFFPSSYLRNQNTCVYLWKETLPYLTCLHLKKRKRGSKLHLEAPVYTWGSRH